MFDMHVAEELNNYCTALQWVQVGMLSDQSVAIGRKTRPWWLTCRSRLTPIKSPGIIATMRA
jgi:hypothetical protein